MELADGKRVVRHKRVYRTVAEKRRIVELTFESGASVARVAQAEGVNSHQVFDWRRAYLKGRLEPKERKSSALLPVVLSPTEKCTVAVDTAVTEKTAVASAAALPGSSIHIELSGRARIRVESGADATLLRAALEMLRP